MKVTYIDGFLTIGNCIKLIYRIYEIGVQESIRRITDQNFQKGLLILVKKEVRGRERKGEREIETYIYIYIYVSSLERNRKIYIYIYTYT